jgi:hypothetical protein
MLRASEQCTKWPGPNCCTIHKPITGLSPWRHPLGKWPVMASLEGHIVYGFILGFIIFTFLNVF